MSEVVSAVLAYLSSSTKRCRQIKFGECDVATKLLTKGLATLDDFVSDHVRNVRNVLVISTMIISRKNKAKSQRLTKAK